MGKSLIINRINNKNHSFYVPAGETEADTFASTFLDGEYQVLKVGTTIGTDTETAVNDVNMMVKNSTSGQKAYLNMLTKSTKSEDELFSAVIGLTINGVLVDEAYIISMKRITY